MDYTRPENQWIWLKPRTNSEFDIPLGCRIIRYDRGKILVKDDDNRESWVSSDQIYKQMHITSIEGVDDMITLGDLQEHSILRNIHIRYKQRQIYTYTGTMLVAINPYETLPIYTDNTISQYRGKKLGCLPPHIYAIGDSAFQSLSNCNQDQCIVISGESGAGKTESMKLILRYLAAISKKPSSIEQQIIEANPILEAFGNAKTTRNDNSSRFGKYIDIHFDRNGVIQGAKVDHYLLEKSRIVSSNNGERNYHIFYLLLAGLSAAEKNELELKDASVYHYLTSGGTVTCDGRNDRDEFSNLKTAMKVLSFTDKDIWEIFKLLAALLHLGNLKYKSIVVQNIDATEVHDVPNSSRVASFLGIPRSALCDCLTRRTLYVHGERVVSSISIEQAIETRDAFVKAVYGRIFNMIVNRINKAIYNKDAISSKVSIGVLDIFGFENFAVNSFEQLCINYANESLQQFFVHNIFKMEQEEYNKDKINWSQIQFIDNQNVLDMIGVKPVNIMSLIDEESKFPKGSDQTLLSKLHSTHGTKSIYVKPRSDLNTTFGIQHFAGVVFYNSSGFLEKNRDAFSLDLKEVIGQSTNNFLLDLFSSKNSLDSSKRSMTLSLQFKTSLDELIRTLSACHPFFIRCIKPNEYKKPRLFDKDLCIRQLRYSGMMETARIRSTGYPIRHTFKNFVDRYRNLVPELKRSQQLRPRDAAYLMCTKLFDCTVDYQFGQTKIFLKYAEDFHLEQERERMQLKYVVVLQRSFRWLILRRWIKRHRAAAIVIQRYWRGYRMRQKHIVIRIGIERLQASIVSRQTAYNYIRLRRSIRTFQAYCRGFLVRKSLWAKHEAAKLNTMSNEETDEIEANNRVVDEVFEFLQHAMEPVERTHRMSSGVSKMILDFEAQSKIKKIIPTKLLSRPVNFYTYESRL